MLANNEDLNDLQAQHIMSPNPRQIAADELAIEAAQIMQEYKITQLIVTENHTYIGMVHLHDLYQEGIIG